MSGAVALLLLDVALGGCRAADNGNEWANDPDALVHPVRDSLLSSATGAPVRSVAADDDPDPEIAGILADLSAFDSGGSFGQVDGASDSVLGELIDAVVLSDSNIAILDRSYGVVRIVTPAMAPRAVLGGFGQGPGEVEEPVAIFEQPQGWVTVVDAGGNRLERFRFSPSPDTTVRTPLPVLAPHDGCAIGLSTFVVGTDASIDLEKLTAEIRSPATIHELNASGTLIQSFSTPYAFLKDYLVASIYGEAVLACEETPAGGELWVAYSTLGEVHAMNADGDLHWIVSLADFHYPNQVQTSTAMGMDPAQAHLVELISDISLVAESLLAVQVTSIDRTDRSRPETSYRTYVLDKKSGWFMGAFSGSHEVLGAGDHEAVLYRAVPYPKISIVSWN